MKNVLTMLGGVLTIVSMFLSFVSAGGMSLTGMETMKAADTAWEAYMWIGLGAVIIICALMGKKALNILTLVLGLAIAGIAVKYKIDAADATGIGIWVMIGGGALTVIGSIMSLVRKTA